MTIRAAKAEDFERVRDMLLEEDMTNATFFTSERFAKGIENFPKYYLVEERDGKVVGFVSGFDDRGAFYGYMGRLVVDPDYRNQGIGENLAMACLEQFPKGTIVFSGVKKSNHISDNLTRKMGYIDEGYKLIYIETDLI